MSNHVDHDALAYDAELLPSLAHLCQVCGQPMPFDPIGRTAVIEDAQGYSVEGKIVRAFDDEGVPSYRVLVTDGDDTEVRTLPVSEVALYLGTFGDWVRMADGTAATVTRANPAYDNRQGRGGTYYDLMFKGGAEKHLYHWQGDSFLTDGQGHTQGLFTVVSQDA